MGKCVLYLSPGDNPTAVNKYIISYHLKYLCKLARYWLQAHWGWHDSVETCRSVIICEIIVHLLVIVQNLKKIDYRMYTYIHFRFVHKEKYTDYWCVRFVLRLISALWFFTMYNTQRGLSPLSVPQVRIKTRIRDNIIASQVYQKCYFVKGVTSNRWLPDDFCSFLQVA